MCGSTAEERLVGTEDRSGLPIADRSIDRLPKKKRDIEGRSEVVHHPCGLRLTTALRSGLVVNNKNFDLVEAIHSLCHVSGSKLSRKNGHQGRRRATANHLLPRSCAISYGSIHPSIKCRRNCLTRPALHSTFR